MQFPQQDIAKRIRTAIQLLLKNFSVILASTPAAAMTETPNRF